MDRALKVRVGRIFKAVVAGLPAVPAEQLAAARAKGGSSRSHHSRLTQVPETSQHCHKHLDLSGGIGRRASPWYTRRGIVSRIYTIFGGARSQGPRYCVSHV
jgi:hypothetical protein